MFKIGLFLIGVFVISELGLIVLILLFRSKIQEDINNAPQKLKKSIIGRGYGGVFYSQPLIPLYIEVKEKSIQENIKKHNKLIIFFYANIITLLVGICLLNF